MHIRFKISTFSASRITCIWTNWIYAWQTPFDTIPEIRLVDGYHLDAVWQAVGRHLTIYGKGMVNVNSAKRPVLLALLAAYADGVYSDLYLQETVTELIAFRGAPRAEGGVHFTSANHFKAFVENTLQASVPLRPQILKAITTESMVFRVQSHGEVNDSRVTIYAIIDYAEDPTGRIMYWKVE